MSYITYNGKYVTYNGKMVTDKAGGGITPYLNINTSSLTFDEWGTPCAGSTISVSSNTAWAVTYGDTWVYGTNSGSGNGSISLTVVANEGLPGRNTNITVSATGCSNQICTIYQLNTGQSCS